MGRRRVTDGMEEFFERWPHMFRDVYCGFYLPRGWRDLVFALCERLEAADLSKTIQVAQVKEKFGGLRFYVDVDGYEDIEDRTEGNPRYDEYSKLWKHVHSLTSEAESMSTWICQDCGTLRKTSRKSDSFGWVGTLCEGCRQVHEDERKGKI